MTCIVGVEHNGVVYMGGDSAATDMSSLETLSLVDAKVFPVGELIVGFCGSLRMGQLLKYALVPPEHPEKKDDMSYLVVDLMDAVRNCHREHGFLKKEDEKESQTESSFLLGYRGHVYYVEEEFEVERSLDGYAAVGCGSNLALGSMFATKHVSDPEVRIKLALEAAAHHNAGVRPPFYTVKSQASDSFLKKKKR